MRLFENFINYLSYEKRFSQHTILAYKKDIEQYFDLMDLHTDNDVLQVNYQLLRSYLVSLVGQELENTTINRKLSSVKTFYKYLRQQGEIEINPTAKIKSLKQKKTLPQFVPENQLWDKSLFEEEKDEFLRLQIELIIELFYQTGIRLSELIGLEERNVSSESIKVLGKRNKERIIPISKSLFDLVNGFRLIKTENGLESNLLLITKKGKKLSPKFVYSRVNYYLGKTTNLSKKSPHILRHTFATHMLNNGASLESIKKLLGHVDLSATQIYTHNSFKKIKSIYEQSHPRGAS